MKTAALFIIAVIAAIVASWAVNIWKLTNCDFQAPYRCETVHALGIIPVISPVVVWVGTDGDTP